MLTHFDFCYGIFEAFEVCAAGPLLLRKRKKCKHTSTLMEALTKEQKKKLEPSRA